MNVLAYTCTHVYMYGSVYTRRCDSQVSGMWLACPCAEACQLLCARHLCNLERRMQSVGCLWLHVRDSIHAHVLLWSTRWLHTMHMSKRGVKNWFFGYENIWIEKCTGFLLPWFVYKAVRGACARLIRSFSWFLGVKRPLNISRLETNVVEHVQQQPFAIMFLDGSRLQSCTVQRQPFTIVHCSTAAVYNRAAEQVHNCKRLPFKQKRLM
jgi:hypothetical protein